MKPAREARKIRASAATVGWNVKLLASRPSRAVRAKILPLSFIAQTSQGWIGEEDAP
jgi:hypothetical protein